MQKIQTSSHDAQRQAEAQRDAFRRLHGRRLHGFALLVTLGDRARSARLAAAALAAGEMRADELGHPERAAAWLRRRVLRGITQDSRRQVRSDDVRRQALSTLGVDEATYYALARLTVSERAAVVAGYIEGLAPLDLEVVLKAAPPDVRRRLIDGRRRFLVSHPLVTSADRVADPDPGHGPLATRIASIADRALPRPGT